MKDLANHARIFFGLGALLFVSTFLWVCVERSRSKAAIDEAHRQLAALQAELEGRKHELASLDDEQRQVLDPKLLQAKTWRADPFISDARKDLISHLTALAIQQSNLAMLVQSLLAKTSDNESPEMTAERRDAALRVLNTAAQQNRQKLETARQSAAELLITLDVRPEISTMDARQALDTVSLSGYWPFFEAKRKRDALQGFADRLRARLMQERVDGAAQLAEVEAVAQEEQQHLQVAKQKAAQLLTTLSVPDEISRMEANKALDTAGLRAYWPFFEAKRERDVLQTLEDRLRMRLIQEQVDAAAAARKQ